MKKNVMTNLRVKSLATWVIFGLFSLSSSTPFKVEAKLEIPSYDGQIDIERLNSWLKQLEVYFSVYKIKEMQKISFAPLKMS